MWGCWTRQALLDNTDNIICVPSLLRPFIAASLHCCIPSLLNPTLLQVKEVFEKHKGEGIMGVVNLMGDYHYCAMEDLEDTDIMTMMQVRYLRVICVLFIMTVERLGLLSASAVSNDRAVIEEVEPLHHPT
jgi:hypothetical protein